MPEVIDCIPVRYPDGRIVFEVPAPPRPAPPPRPGIRIVVDVFLVVYVVTCVWVVIR